MNFPRDFEIRDIIINIITQEKYIIIDIVEHENCYTGEIKETYIIKNIKNCDEEELDKDIANDYMWSPWILEEDYLERKNNPHEGFEF